MITFSMLKMNLRQSFHKAICLTAIGAMTALSAVTLPAQTASAQALQTRVKDIVRFEGVRENLLVGYGLVVGLNGTGDSLNSAPFTEESLVAMLERLGVNTRGLTVDTDNVAAVMVTASLPPFARQGDKVDVQVSALADAEDLLGGTLLVTPLLGADGEVYAVAQGPVATAAIVAQGDAASVVRGVPTSGRVPGGAIVEREIDFELNSLTEMTLSLRNPDFTTALRIAQTINARLGSASAFAQDPSSVVLQIPEQYSGDIVSLIADIESLRVSPDQIARVVVDETSGVIVMGANVRISEVAIAQGNLTIRVTETPQVSQPNPFSETGDTVVVPRTELEIDTEQDNQLTVLEEGITLQQLVEGLNALGVGPRDIITILQSIKAAGALQAELEII